ncbi:MAG: S41 family peptidase [Flavobacteriales bacterium]
MKRLLGITVCAASVLGIQAQSSKEFADQQSKIDRLYQLLEKSYTTDIDLQKVTEAAIKASLKELDPHSYYLTADEIKQSNESLQGGFDGIGISYILESDTLVVTSLVKDGPAEKAGILPGDKLIQVDDSLVCGSDEKTRKISQLLRGKKGTRVITQFVREGEGTRTFEMDRDKIPVYTVPSWYMVNDEIGYVKIVRFGAETGKDFREALKKLKKQGMKKLIVDLQDNSGGYLNTAVDLCDEFLDKEKLIVFTEGKNSPRKDFFAKAGGIFEEGELVVLVNENSASASEILSGAMQDHDRAVLVGRRTYGKGLVQNTFYFSDGSAIRLTTARYFTPSGRCIQKPYDEGTEKYFETLRNRMDSGELTSADSIKMQKELQYATGNKRLVFAAGGVMPDIFVPRDTLEKDSTLRSLNRKNVLYRHCVQYTNAHRRELMKHYEYSFANFLKDFALPEGYTASLENFSKKLDVPFSFGALNSRQANYVVHFTKANMARMLWDNNEYQQCLNEEDESVKKAIELLTLNKTAVILEK